MEKTCKQCGRSGEESQLFRRYASRSHGVRQTTQGYHTVCKECENFNANALRVYNKPVEKRTSADELLLKKANALYHGLAARGNRPVGKLAEIMLGCSYSEARGRSDTTSLPSVKFADSFLSEWGESLIQDNQPLPLTESGDNSVKTWAPSKSAATIKPRQDYKSFEQVEQELKELLKQIESGQFTGDALDMDGVYTDIWSGANKKAFDSRASVQLKYLDSMVSSLISTKMREES